MESAPRGGPSDPKFWWFNNGDILVRHPRCESSSSRRRNEPLGYYVTILDRMFRLVGAYYRGEAEFSLCCKYISKILELFTSKYEWTYLHTRYSIWNVQPGKVLRKSFSGYSCIQSKLTVEWGGTFEILKCPLQTRWCTKSKIRT